MPEAVDAGGAEIQGGLTEDEKRENLVRLVFEGDASRCEAFCRAIRRNSGNVSRSRGKVLDSRARLGQLAPDDDRTHLGA